MNGDGSGWDGASGDESQSGDGSQSGDECPMDDPFCNGPGPDGPVLPQELDVDVTLRTEDGTELKVVHISDNSGIFMGPMMGEMIGQMME